MLSLLVSILHASASVFLSHCHLIIIDFSGGRGNVGRLITSCVDYREIFPKPNCKVTIPDKSRRNRPVRNLIVAGRNTLEFIRKNGNVLLIDSKNSIEHRVSTRIRSCVAINGWNDRSMGCVCTVLQIDGNARVFIRIIVLPSLVAGRRGRHW